MIRFDSRSLAALALAVGYLAAGCGDGSRACETRAGCSAAEICLGGTCQAEQPCESTEDCSGGLLCDDVRCVECLDNGDCLGGRVCTQGTCTAPGVGGCAADDECGSGMVCDEPEEECVECVVAGDCDGGELCEDNACVEATECESTLECPTGRVCDTAAGVCVECAGDADCIDEDLICVEHQCVDAPDTCEDDGDCTDQVCDTDAGICVECVEDGDCDSGYECNAANRCVRIPTTMDGGVDDDAGTLDAGMRDSGPRDSGPAEPCDDPGLVEEVACGDRCGTRTRFCSSPALTWTYGPCNEATDACRPGTTQNATCGGETVTQFCSTECRWTGGCELDVVLMIDTTGSFVSVTEPTNIAALVSQLVDPLLASSRDVRISVVGFRDFGDAGTSCGDSSDYTFGGFLGSSASSTAINGVLDAMTVAGGGDTNEGAVIALGQLGGAPLNANDDAIVCPGGTSGRGCWRPGAERAVVVVSDALQHGAPGVAVLCGASWTDTRGRLIADGIDVFALTTSTSATMWSTMETDLGASSAARIVAPSGLTGIADWSPHYAALFGLMSDEYGL